MKAIIIDDERLARQELRNLLAVHKEILPFYQLRPEWCESQVNQTSCFPQRMRWIFLPDQLGTVQFFVSYNAN